MNEERKEEGRKEGRKEGMKGMEKEERWFVVWKCE